MLILPQSKATDFLFLLTGATHPLAGCKVHLYQNNITPTPQSLLTDFTTADFTGYAVVSAVDWTDPYFLPNGLAAADADPCHYVAGSPLTVANTIYGYYITDSAGTDLLAAGRFAAPVPIAVASAGLTFAPQITFPAVGWGA